MSWVIKSRRYYYLEVETMPEAMEQSLKKAARKKGLSKEKAGAYVYGTMRKTGWKPAREKSHKVDKHQQKQIDEIIKR